jgi:hypothetical protein
VIKFISDLAWQWSHSVYPGPSCSSVCSTRCTSFCTDSFSSLKRYQLMSYLLYLGRKCSSFCTETPGGSRRDDSAVPQGHLSDCRLHLGFGLAVAPFCISRAEMYLVLHRKMYLALCRFVLDLEEVSTNEISALSRAAIF